MVTILLYKYAYNYNYNYILKYIKFLKMHDITGESNAMQGEQ